MFARCDENPAMTLQDIKETERYGRTEEPTHGHTDGQRENSIPIPNKVCGGYKKGAAQAHLSLHLSKSNIVGNHMLGLKYIMIQQTRCIGPSKQGLA